MTKEIKNIDLFLEGVSDKNIVKGFSHDFYNSPARFLRNLFEKQFKLFLNQRI